MRSYWLRSFALGEGGTTPEIAFRRLALAHGLTAQRAVWRRKLVFLSRLDALGHEPFAKAAGFFKGLALRFNLAFQHVQGAPDNNEHGVGHHHRVIGIEPPGVLLALLQRMFSRLVHHVIGERSRIQRDGIYGFCVRGMD